FDVVHLHEPLAPSPALAPLSRAPALRAVSFHRPELLAGVAFLGPLVERALSRVHIRTVADEGGRRALLEILPSEYELVAPGVDEARFPSSAVAASSPKVVLIARGRDRVGARFALSVARGLALDDVGEIVLIGPPDAPWRTRAIVPKALRERVSVMPDSGVAARSEAFAGAHIALFGAPEDASGPVMREAMATGCAIVSPRTPAIEGVLRHGQEALLLPPFSAPGWIARVNELARDTELRTTLGQAGRAHAGLRTWNDVAQQLEGLYDAAHGRRSPPLPRRVLIDLHVRASAQTDPAAVVEGALSQGLDAIGVAGPDGVGVASRIAEEAGDRLQVIPGAEVTTQEGVVVGLFLDEDVKTGEPLASTLAAIHAQGGVAMVPHPDVMPAPGLEALRQHADAIDCYELSCAAADDARGGDLALRLGMIGCATSGAELPAEIGALATELGAFSDGPGLLDALASDPVTRAAPERRARLRRKPARET
ncbi:MAG: glycosyltransferase, partial [Miltoncostaeaceae bacterium]